MSPVMWCVCGTPCLTLPCQNRKDEELLKRRNIALVDDDDDTAGRGELSLVNIVEVRLLEAAEVQVLPLVFVWFPSSQHQYDNWNWVHLPLGLLYL